MHIYVHTVFHLFHCKNTFIPHEKCKISYSNIILVRKIFVRIFNNVYWYYMCTCSRACTVQSSFQASLDGASSLGYSAHLCNHHLEGCFVSIWHAVSIANFDHVYVRILWKNTMKNFSDDWARLKIVYTIFFTRKLRGWKWSKLYYMHTYIHTYIEAMD